VNVIRAGRESEYFNVATGLLDARKRPGVTVKPVITMGMTMMRSAKSIQTASRA
jgi:hypothetical protein